MKRKHYSDIITVLDIETSKFHSNRIGEYYDNFVADFAYSTTVYLWGVKEYNYNEMVDDINDGKGDYNAFRIFDDVDKYFRSFNDEVETRLVYCHNLPYEISYILPNLIAKYGLKNLFKVEEDGTISTNSFMGDSFRKPFKVVFNCWPKIEFRCSYKMLNKSLEKVGESLGIDKHLYKSDYDSIYTSASYLPPEEYLYNESDLDITAMGICKAFSSGNKFNAITTSQLAKIYSSTSFCKLNVQEIMTYNGLRQMAKELRGNKPRNIHWYDTINLCYVGGYTHLNMTKAGELIGTGTDEKVYSADLTSAYPSNMFVKMYPSYVHQGTWEQYKRFKTKKGFFGVVAFYDITIKEDIPMTYISTSWMIDYKNISVDNGKLVHAEYVAVGINDIMFSIILEHYNIKKWKVVDDLEDYPFLICTDFKYLKPSYIRSILYYAEQKTYWKKLGKTLPEESEEWYDSQYMLGKAKNQLNSMYGCHAMRPIRNMISLKDYLYTREANEVEKNKRIEEYYTSQKPYDLVVASYITTYTHQTIFQMIDRIHQEGGTIIYVDTDSCKFQCESEEKALDIIKKQNDSMSKEIVTDLQKEFLELDNFYSFDYEGCYDGGFKALGSKKYGYIKDGHISLTIAGVPKAATKVVNKRYKKGYYKNYSLIEILDHTIEDGRIFTPRDYIYNFWDVNLTSKLGCKYITDGIYKNDEIITDANGESVPVEDYFGCLLFDNEYRLSDSDRSEDCWSFVGVTNKSMEDDYNIYGTN